MIERTLGMKLRALHPLAALATVAAFAAGCGARAADTHAGPHRDHDAEAVDHAGMDHDAGMDHGAHGAHAAHGLDATAGPGFTVADVHFMQMMIGHHDQALRMAIMAPSRTTSPDLLALALKIDISQRDEIRTMAEWLAERGQPVPTEEQILAMEMPGMVTPEQFTRLEAARGADFDRLFLSLMIGHHVGAIEMVDDLFASPGAAQDSDIFRFATDVGADQLDEISAMERMLERLESPSPSETR